MINEAHATAFGCSEMTEKRGKESPQHWKPYTRWQIASFPVRIGMLPVVSVTLICVVVFVVWWAGFLFHLYAVADSIFVI